MGGVCNNKHRLNPETGKYFCLRCKEHVDLDHFRQIPYGKDGNGNPKRINLMCIVSNKSVNPDLEWGYKTEEYRRNQWLKDIYNITLHDWNNMFSDQNGCCAICSTHQTEMKKILCVDHNHDTGCIRGLLCHNCNSGLGSFKDSIFNIEKVISYLEKERLFTFIGKSPINYKKNTKEYYRNSVLWYEYGICIQDYDYLYNLQNGVCAICEEPPSKNRVLAVDHDHSDSKVRGLLCSRCNKGIGLFQEDINIIKKALLYLDKYK